MNSQIDANWLSSTVMALCNEARKTGDYSMMPVLSDALQDAGCDDQELIVQLQDRGLTPIRAQRFVCLILGGDFAKAVEWIDEFAKGFDPEEGPWGDPHKVITYDTLIDLANEHNSLDGRGYDWERHFDDNADEFWKKYCLITGADPQDDQRDRELFWCSC